MYNLWIWEQPFWRVFASYDTRREARAAGRHSADPPDSWAVTKVGSQEDEYMQEHCRERFANRERP